MKKNFIIIFNFLIIIGLIEIGTRLFVNEKIDESCTNCRAVTKHPLLGYFQKPNTTHTATKWCGPDLCYKATYSYDEIGRRYTKNEKFNQTPLLLLGCSFTFGEGLNDNETLAYKLQTKLPVRVFNYSKPAANAAHSLTVLRSDSLLLDIGKQKSLAVFVALRFQIERESLSSSNPWTWDTPAYQKMDETHVTPIGTQSESAPLHYFFYKNYLYLKKYSHFLKWLNLNFATLSAAENEDLYLATLAEAQKTFESKMNGRFIVVLHPLSDPPSEKMLKFFEKNKISFYQINLPDTTNSYGICSCDAHPNEKLNEYFATKLQNIIESELAHTR